MVPLKACLGGPAGAAGPGGGAAAAGGGGTCGGGGAVEAFPGWFIMSIVPLNLGAAAPFMLNPHFVQVVAVSGFFVPQFGQNKCASEAGAFTQLATPTDAPLYATRKPPRFSSFSRKPALRAGFISITAQRGLRPRAHRSKSGMGPHPHRASGAGDKPALQRQLFKANLRPVSAIGRWEILERWRRITALTPRPSAH